MKKLLVALFGILLVTNVSAQYISPFFTSMPNDIVDYLSASNRQDLVDFYKAGKVARIENLLKGQTELKILSADFIDLQMNESATFQMKILHLSDTAKIIAINQTVCGPACDSHLRFFSTTWKELNARSILPAITINDFVVTENKDDQILKIADIQFFRYTLNKDNTELTVSLDVKNYLGKEDLKKIEPMLKPSITLHWKDGKYVK